MKKYGAVIIATRDVNCVVSIDTTHKGTMALNEIMMIKLSSMEQPSYICRLMVARIMLYSHIIACRHAQAIKRCSAGRGYMAANIRSPVYNGR